MPGWTLEMRGDRARVGLTREFEATPLEVWRKLTDVTVLRSWFPCEVIVEGGDWRVGASITFLFPPEVIDMTLHGEVLEVFEPGRLSFSWGEDDVLTFDLTESGEGTLLMFANELSAAFAARNAAGWDDCLDRLAGLDVDPSAWRRHFTEYRSDFEAILGPQEGLPEGYKGPDPLEDDELS
ncbi:MAG TPA: SRPBCC domain-containing protein [Acidimicrobiales bacterium]|jgi:uncharacterized protein YndB with AHSA1/START domain